MQNNNFDQNELQAYNERLLELYSTLGFQTLAVSAVRNKLCTCGNANCKAPGKHPLHSGWQNECIRPNMLTQNVGIRTGLRSDVCVLDLDPRNGGADSFERLVEEYGDLPDTPFVHTGGAGRHYYFKCPLGSSKSRASILPGIDFKCEGGFVVAPPSFHVSGVQYDWDLEMNLETLPLASMPPWLIDLVGRDANKNTKPPTNWPTFVTTQIKEGNRNNTLTKLTGHLARRNVDPMVGLALINAWNMAMCIPPLSIDEVCSIVSSIFSREVGYGR